MKTLYKLLAIVMILGLAFTALPMNKVVAQSPAGYEFVVREGGTAALSTEAHHSGSSSIKFTTGNVYDNSDVGMV